MSTANDRAAAFLSQVAYPGTVSNLTTNTARYLKDATRTGSGTARMKALFQNQYAAHTIATPGLVGYWRLDAANGTTELDRSGNGNNGTITGGVTLNQTGAIADGDAAMLFDGSSGEIDNSASAVQLTSGPLSVELWVQKNGVVSSDAGLAGTGFNPTGFQLNWQTGTSIYFNIGDNTLGGHAASASFSSTGWHHVVGTWDGTTGANGIKLYIDGVLSAQATATTTSLTANTFIIGKSIHFFSGWIDEVAVYNVALTAAQVLAKYSQI